MYESRVNPKPGTSQAVHILVSHNKETLKNCFINAHAIEKKSRPYTDFECMCDADRAKRT